jgi:hypothetical protein
MAVIRDDLPAIRALASARLRFDLTTWRLVDYLGGRCSCSLPMSPPPITNRLIR